MRGIKSTDTDRVVRDEAGHRYRVLSTEGHLVRVELLGNSRYAGQTSWATRRTLEVVTDEPPIDTLS